MQYPEYKLGVLAIACAAVATACTDAEGIAAPRSGAAHAKSGLIQAQSLPLSLSLSASTLRSAVGENLCVDVMGASREPGARLITWDCTGDPNQLFTHAQSGAITVYDGAMCLDAGRGRNGDPVVVRSCTGARNQKWERTAGDEVKGVNGKCLDLPGGNTTRGTGLILYGCNGGANQRWVIRAASDGGAVPPVVAEPAPTPPPAPAPTLPAPLPTPVVHSGPAELPRASVNLTMPAATGRTIAVPAGGDLQAALNAAQPGDVVTLAAGATYVGNFVLPAKAGSTAAGGGTIIVRPEASVVLPAANTRLRPAAVAGSLPKLVTTTVDPVLSTEPGAAGWYVMGIEMTAAAAQTLSYGLVVLGRGEETSLEALPSRLVFDRVYVHGHGSLHVKRCFAFNGRYTAVVNSHLSDCHGRGQETQGIAGWNGAGPFHIENNYIEASGIGTMFGGADPRIHGLIPSDIVVRRNYYFKPLEWRGVWTVKNSLECKNCQRLLAEHNVFQNNWADAQAGFMILFQGLTDDNTAPWARVGDITVRQNLIRNSPAGVNLLSRVAYGANAVMPTEPGRRITIEQNVFEEIGQGYGRLFQLGGDLRDVTIANNTGTATNSAVTLYSGDQPPMERLVIRDNVLARGEYGVFGESVGEGTAALTRYASSYTFTGNVVYGSGAGAAPADRYPAGNLFPESAQSAGLTSFSSASVGTLSAAVAPMSLSSTTTNGRPPGADAAALSQAVAGVATR